MIKRLLLACTCAGILAGCSSLNPFASKPDPRTQPAPLPDLSDKKAAEAKLVWRASVGEAGSYAFAPAVVQSSVYAASEKGNLARFDNGQQVWRVTAEKRLSGGVGSDGKVVVVGTDKGDVLAFSATDGHPLWAAKAGSEVLSPPLVTDGLVLVRTGDSLIRAFDATTGKFRWVHQRTAPVLTVRASPGMIALPGMLVSGFPGGKLAAVALNNGALIWELSVASPKGATELERVTDITSLPVVGGQEVCAASYKGRIACFDMTTGQTTWARDVSSLTGMDIDSRTAYVSDDQGNVLAFDRHGGASLWKQGKLFNRNLSRPLAIGAYVLVGDYQGYVHVLRRDDGAIVGRIATDGSAIVADPRRIGDNVLVQTKDGGLFSIAVN